MRGDLGAADGEGAAQRENAAVLAFRPQRGTALDREPALREDAVLCPGVDDAVTLHTDGQIQILIDVNPCRGGRP